MNIQNDILDYLGSEFTEEMLHEEFDGKSLEEIVTTLNEWFPTENNDRLASAILNAI